MSATHSIHSFSFAAMLNPSLVSHLPGRSPCTHTSQSTVWSSAVGRVAHVATDRACSDSPASHWKHCVQHLSICTRATGFVARSIQLSPLLIFCTRSRFNRTDCCNQSMSHSSDSSHGGNTFRCQAVRLEDEPEGQTNVSRHRNKSQPVECRTSAINSASSLLRLRPV